MRLTAFLPLPACMSLKGQGAWQMRPWGMGRGQAGLLGSGLFRPLTLLNLHRPLFRFSCFLLPVCDGTNERRRDEGKKKFTDPVTYGFQTQWHSQQTLG